MENPSLRKIVSKALTKKKEKKKRKFPNLPGTTDSEVALSFLKI